MSGEESFYPPAIRTPHGAVDDNSLFFAQLLPHYFEMILATLSSSQGSVNRSDAGTALLMIRRDVTYRLEDQIDMIGFRRNFNWNWWI